MSGVKPVLVVIDYGMGNLRSVVKAWEHVGAKVRLINRPEDVGDARGLIFPGQGCIIDCMSMLRQSGFDKIITDWVTADKPFFGICLGLQALFEYSEEGETKGLGLLPGKVLRFHLDPEYKVPHMGWNEVKFVRALPPNSGLQLDHDQFYFVHSYHVVPSDSTLIWCETNYGGPFVSGIARGNCFATQFHPEKSQAKGLKIYRNFVDWIKINH